MDNKEKKLLGFSAVKAYSHLRKLLDEDFQI